MWQPSQAAQESALRMLKMIPDALSEFIAPMSRNSLTALNKDSFKSSLPARSYAGTTAPWPAMRSYTVRGSNLVSKRVLYYLRCPQTVASYLAISQPGNAYRLQSSMLNQPSLVRVYAKDVLPHARLSICYPLCMPIEFVLNIPTPSRRWNLKPHHQQNLQS